VVTTTRAERGRRAEERCSERTDGRMDGRKMDRKGMDRWINIASLSVCLSVGHRSLPAQAQPSPSPSPAQTVQHPRPLCACVPEWVCSAHQGVPQPTSSDPGTRKKRTRHWHGAWTHHTHAHSHSHSHKTHTHTPPKKSCSCSCTLKHSPGAVRCRT